MQSPIKTNYDFSLNALRRVLLCLCEYYQSRMQKGRKTIYECQSTSFFLPPPNEARSCMKPFLPFSLPIFWARGSQVVLGGKRFHHPAEAGMLLALGRMYRLVWSMWTRAHGECHGSCGWMPKGRGEDSAAGRASRGRAVTDALGGPVAASCSLTGYQGDACSL